ncbi:CDP-alcohol phosphatidyltransferase family protein [Limnochorda pilosa]|uniref:CDP-alcohol phosphatidyltransferase n=1 Tax=Limnochorda pilosa TaxID=1555112 RepID=A0A0K2SQC4_LIMPI|nr:CDP-alcohol phosphatidyltransferase family protein [Limnochorda pilosa]BAS29301.1 hypothetical protein LIP_3489 [Limnochorda pilosa]
MRDHGTLQPQAAPGLTQREQAARDRLLGALVDHLPPGVTPNRLTWLRIALVLIAFILYLRRASLAWQLGVILTAACTDFIDGPLARRRGLTGLQGARLDQRADTLLGVWLGVLSILEAGVPLPILVGLVAGQVAVWGTDYGSRRAVLSGLVVGRGAVPLPSFASRLQFVLVLAGFSLLLTQAGFGWATRRLGEWLLIAAVGSAGVQAVRNLERKPAA